MAPIIDCSRSWGCSSGRNRKPALWARQEFCPRVAAGRDLPSSGPQVTWPAWKESTPGSDRSARGAASPPSSALWRARAPLRPASAPRWERRELGGPFPPDSHTSVSAPGGKRKKGGGRAESEARPAGKGDEGRGSGAFSRGVSHRVCFLAHFGRPCFPPRPAPVSSSAPSTPASWQAGGCEVRGRRRERASVLAGTRGPSGPALGG